MEDINVNKASINPLSKYRTYSYHHILMACDTTEMAEVLANTTNLTGFSRPAGQQFNTFEDPYAKYKPINTQFGNYVILINGLTDAEFVIQDVIWDHALDADPYCGDRHMLSGVAGTMHVHEPRGVRFINVLLNVVNQLNIDFLATTLLLKTVFVGYNTTDTTGFPEPIANVKPIFFTAEDIASEFDITGGRYTIKMAGYVGTLARHPRLITAIERVKINLKKTPVLKDALEKNLQNVMNRAYDDFYDSSIKLLKDSNPDFVGKKVKYVIKVAKPYDMPTYVVDTFHETSKDSGATNEAGIMDLSGSGIVEEAIMKVLKRCSQVQKDAAGLAEDEQEFTYTPRITSAVVVTETEYVINYIVSRVILPRSNILSLALERENNSLDDQSAELLKNLVVYNYIYTGKNVDIIDLDLKLDFTAMGNMRVQSQNYLTENKDLTKGDGLPEITSTNKFEPKSKVNTDSNLINIKSPVVMPTTKVSCNNVKNTPNQRFVDLMQHAFENMLLQDNIITKFTITGNPGFLNSINRTPTEICNPDDKQETSEEDVFPFWERIPSLVKLNIRMPSDDNDTSVFTEPFFFDTIYFVQGIINKFENGLFTQELKVKSIPPTESIKDQVGTPEATQIRDNTEKEKTELPCPPGFAPGTKVNTSTENAQETTSEPGCIEKFTGLSPILTGEPERKALGTLINATNAELPPFSIDDSINDVTNSFRSISEANNATPLQNEEPFFIDDSFFEDEVILNAAGIVPPSSILDKSDFADLAQSTLGQARKIGGNLSELPSKIDSVLSEGGIVGGIDDVKSVVDSAISKGTDFLQNSLGQIQKDLFDIGNNLLSEVLDIESLDELEGIIDGVVDDLKNPIDTIENLVDEGVMVAEGLVDDAETTINNVYGSAVALGQNIADSAQDAKNLVNSLAAVEYVPPDIDLDQITTFEDVTNTYNAAVTSMTETMQELGGIREEIESKISTITDGIQEIPTSIDDVSELATPFMSKINQFSSSNVSDLDKEFDSIFQKQDIASTQTILRGQAAKIIGFSRKPTTSGVSVKESNVVINTTIVSKSGSRTKLAGINNESKTPREILLKNFL